MRSDPAIAIRQSVASALDAGAHQPAAPPGVSARPPAARSRRWPARVLLGGVSLSLAWAAVGAVLSSLAGPMTRADAADAPAWPIEITAGGDKAVTAIVFGREVGIHIVRVPAASASPSEPRIVPARLARGDIHMLSLGLSPLVARATAPPGAKNGIVAWSARARSITAYESERVSGVRAGW